MTACECDDRAAGRTDLTSKRRGDALVILECIHPAALHAGDTVVVPAENTPNP